jgi:hypothetical protein
MGGIALGMGETPSHGWDGTPNKIYMNQGKLVFADVSDTAGCTGPKDGEGWGTVLFDFDRDGDLDIYITNDFRPDTWCSNNGDGTFKDVSDTLVPHQKNPGIMGIDLGDTNGDGCVDMVATNFGPDFVYTATSSGQYIDTYNIAIGDGADPSTLISGWGVALLDADHDGDQDLVSVAAYDQFTQDAMTPGSAAFLENRGGLKPGGLLDVGSQVNDLFGLPLHAYGLAVGDIDNDGDLDILIGVNGVLPKGASPPRGYELPRSPILLKNDSDLTDRHALFIELKQPPPNARAVGATVVVSVGGRRTARVVTAGTSYLSQHALPLHFGLGTASAPDWVAVQWPGGQTQLFTDVSGPQLTLTRSGASCTPAGRCEGIKIQRCIDPEEIEQYTLKTCNTVCERLEECEWLTLLDLSSTDQCREVCLAAGFPQAEIQCILNASCGAKPECLREEPNGQG